MPFVYRQTDCIPLMMAKPDKPEIKKAVGWGDLANPSISRLQTLGFVPHPSLRNFPG